MNNKWVFVSILIAIGLVIMAIIVSNNATNTSSSFNNMNNVSMADGKQIIEINARGGYEPSTSIAKAGIPTIIRFKTNGTFDCSASISIPSLRISRLLPYASSTDIDAGTPNAGDLTGTCGMGMYNFMIKFR